MRLSLAHPLELILVGNCVWTYGECNTRLPISDLIERRSQGFRFVGVTGHDSVQGDFLSNLLINYEYNHLKGTHRELFKIKAIEISNYEASDYCLKLDQKIVRERNSLTELLMNPIMVILPQIYLNHVSSTKILGTKRKLRSMLTVVFEGLSYGIKISSRSDRNFL